MTSNADFKIFNFNAHWGTVSVMAELPSLDKKPAETTEEDSPPVVSSKDGISFPPGVKNGGSVYFDPKIEKAQKEAQELAEERAWENAHIVSDVICNPQTIDDIFLYQQAMNIPQ